LTLVQPLVHIELTCAAEAAALRSKRCYLSGERAGRHLPARRANHLTACRLRGHEMVRVLSPYHARYQW